MIDRWKDKGLTSKSWCSVNVSNEVPVIPVFSKLVGLIACKGWQFSQGATLLWPLIFGGLFSSLED